MEQWAQHNTDCKKAFFHGHIRLAPGERLLDAQWMEAVERKEKTLGFAGCPRMVSFHIDQATGEKHLHVAWFRLDFEKERALDPGLYKNKLKHLSRECEKDFGLQIVSNDRQPNDLARAADRNEFEEARRLDTDLKAIRSAILDSFQKSDNGRSFAAAIKAQGFVIAQGDRRDCLVVVDQEGGHHALNKKLTGMTAAEIRQRLADLDRSQLPTVEQAQEMQAERAATRGLVDDIRPPAPEAVQAHEAAAAPSAPEQSKPHITEPPRGPEAENSFENLPPMWQPPEAEAPPSAPARRIFLLGPWQGFCEGASAHAEMPNYWVDSFPHDKSLRERGRFRCHSYWLRKF